jgi:hypothetical protein
MQSIQGASPGFHAGDGSDYATYEIYESRDIMTASLPYIFRGMN